MVILAHPNPGVWIDFAMSARAEPAQRARLVDDPSPRVRAALAHGPEVYHPRTKVAPLPDAACVRLLDDPAPSVRAALLDSPHLAPSFVASTATHHSSAARRKAVRAWEILPPGERSALLAAPDPEVRRATALWECPRDARVTAELLRDPKSAAEALSRGLLARTDAERCVAERTHLAALAENPSLPADLVERLAVDSDAGRGARVPPPALVPPSADPPGDTRRHPRGLPQRRMWCGSCALTGRHNEKLHGHVQRHLGHGDAPREQCQHTLECPSRTG